LAAIHRSSNYLQCLAEDFMLIRKVQGSGIQLPEEPLLAEPLTRELLELYMPTAKVCGVTLQMRTVGTPRPISANRPALKIMISALLDNAIKYGPANEQVEILCRYDDWRFELEVHDAGEGIPPQDKERVFERFFRGSATGQVRGSGLGLFGVRILANAMGGHAEIDEHHKRGNCFRIWLPFS
jgi:signal transduction histidine kinase